MKQYSTKNMILSHLKDIKAKIEQKSINNIELLFEGSFYDKYAGRSPERILCLYSVRLVPHFHAVAVPPGAEYKGLSPSATEPAKTYPFILDPFQKESVLCIENNQSVSRIKNL